TGPAGGTRYGHCVSCAGTRTLVPPRRFLGCGERRRRAFCEGILLPAEVSYRTLQVSATLDTAAFGLLTLSANLRLQHEACVRNLVPGSGMAHRPKTRRDEHPRSPCGERPWRQKPSVQAGDSCVTRRASRRVSTLQTRMSAPRLGPAESAAC